MRSVITNKWGSTPTRLSKRGLVLFGILFGVVGCALLLRSSAATPPTVTVTNTSAGTIQTQLSTNNVWAGMVDKAPGGQAKLNALHAPLVRLHVGDDGGALAEPMPELTYNQWNFANLDTLVNDVFNSGQEPLMNIKFAPDWQWSCAAPQTGQAGSVSDQTFQNYAQYLARLVSYYNKGSITTETGAVITNPAGTTHKITYWEPWNEPDLGNETPCIPASGVGLTPAQYLTMWNAVTAAMLQVDPGLKFVGPATAGSQFGSSTTTGNQYVDTIMTNAVTKPSVISFHDYGYWDNTVTDQWIFDGDHSDPVNNCCGGITDIVKGVNAIHTSYPTLPIWLTEVNVNADWGADTYMRPWSEYAAAWWGSAFQQVAPLNVGVIHQFDVADGPQFGLFDDTTGNVHITYYVMQLLDQEFPPGSTILSSSSDTNGILSLAVRRPDGHVSVMVVNRQLVSSTVRSSCGTGGVAATVTVNLRGFSATSATLQQLDKSNVNCTSGAATAPTVQTVNIANPLTLTFPGYGLAVFDLTTSSGGGTVVPGDVNGDGHVTIIDLSILLSHYGQTVSANTNGDLDGDGTVSIIDLSILLTNYGR